MTPAQDESARLALALEAAQLGVWQWDLRAGALLWETPRARAIFGMDDGARWIDSGAFGAQFLHPDDVDGFRNAMASFALGGAAFYFQGRYRRRGESTTRWMECFGAMMACDAAGARLVGTVADVSGRMTTAHALLRTVADLTEAQARRTELLSMLVHELRSSMAAIRQVGSAMDRGLRRIEPLIDALDDLRTQGG
jgi:hypothetical protein